MPGTAVTVSRSERICLGKMEMGAVIDGNSNPWPKSLVL